MALKEFSVVIGSGIITRMQTHRLQKTQTYFGNSDQNSFRRSKEVKREKQGHKFWFGFNLVSQPYNLRAVPHHYLKVMGSEGELLYYNYYHHVLSSLKCRKSATAAFHATASVPRQTDTNSVTKLNAGILCNAIFKCQHVTFVSQNEGKLKWGRSRK